MAFVLDAAIAVGWVVARQSSPYSRRLRLRARGEPYHAPSLWRLETANALRSLERRRAISADAADTAVGILERMEPVIHETAIRLGELLRLARKYDLSAYDAAYLALALELKMPLACGDGPLRAASGRAGIRLA